jgi:hypothetical protein
MRFVIAAAGALAIMTPGLAMAETPERPSAHDHLSADDYGKSSKADESKHPMPDIGAIFALFDKIFPPQPDPDPARLASAQVAVASMWPDGTYGHMMTGMLGGIVDRTMAMKTSDFAMLSGKSGDSDGPDMSIHDAVAADDPHFDERIAAIRAVVDEEMGKVSAVLDPRMRDGLARTLARRFDETQLAEINAFFATPTGRTFAAQYLQLWLSPDTMRSIFTSMPEMIALMPEMMKKVKAASDRFPSPKKDKASHKKS